MVSEEPVALLVEQHQHIDDLFRRTLDATGETRQHCFVELRRMIAAHETAEEMLVHPRLRWVAHDGDALAKHRLNEETRLKEELAELEKLDVSSTEFGERLQAARAMSMAHNGAEETEEFPVLEKELDENQRHRLRRRITMVEKLAPTRPHPGLELGGENVLGGGIVAMVDHARDLFAKDVP